MVLRSQVRGDRSSAAVAEIESRPETEVTPDVEHLTEVEITVPIIGDFGTARPGTTEKLGKNGPVNECPYGPFVPRTKVPPWE